jgi:hypothetical protein
VPGFITTFGVANWTISVNGSIKPVSRNRATIPATCGDAMEVPERVKDALSPVLVAERMAAPGANKSTQVPKLEVDALRSFLSVDATVKADCADAGLRLQASELVFPADTTTTTPVATRSATAVLRAALNMAPILAFRTYLAVGLACFKAAT